MLHFEKYDCKLAADLLPENKKACANKATAGFLYDKYKITREEILKAGKMLNAINELLIKEFKIGYYITDKAPEKYSELQKFKGQIIPIFSGGCKDTIYPEQYMNYNFRAVHDYCHLHTDSDFSEEGEKRAIYNHYFTTFYKLPLSMPERERLICLKVFLADTLGQVKYYYTHKQFVKNQIGFVESIVNHTDFVDLLCYEFKTEEVF